MVVILFAGFSLGDKTKLPSALVGQPFPEFSLPDLIDDSTRRRSNLLGKPRLVNVWATWCPTCLEEHSVLLDISDRTGISIIGVNYRDVPDDARSSLAKYGDPYDFIIVDRKGDLGLDLGVYGAPETFLVDREGIVRHKHVGNVTSEVWLDEIEPLYIGIADDGLAE